MSERNEESIGMQPNGSHTDDDTQQRVTGADSSVDAGKANAEPVRTGGDRELPIPDYDELSVRGAKVRLDALSPDELRTIRAHENENKKRKTLIHEIDRRLR